MLSEYIGHSDHQNGFILVRHKIIRTIKLLARKGGIKTETGGILLGCYRPPHIDVTSLTTIQKQDQASKFGFFRKDRSHNRIALYKWKRSRGYVNYIGEWHTHPERHPKPSSIDIAEWRKLLRKEKRDMIFIIGGFKSEWIGIGRYNNGRIIIERSTNTKQSIKLHIN